MIKTILVPVMGLASDEAALETAYLVARLFGAHLDCLHVRAEWARFAATTITEDVAGVVADEFHSAFDAETKALRWRAHRHFTAFCRRHNVLPFDTQGARNAVSAELREITGDADATAIAEARFHDLIVLGRAAAGMGAYAIDPGALVIGAGRPVLLAPRQAPENLAPTVAIAWKETPETARAIAAAMPLLMKADKIVVLAADEGGDRAKTMRSAERSAEQLRRHGLEVKAHAIALHGRSAAETVVKAAEDNGAHMLVMGGYGRARLSELVFGGFTRDILRDCRLPVLLFH